MSETTLQTLEVNGIRMRVAMQGNGPLVLLCHGFPESWHSWRYQMKALADAGWRAAAPDMRGYGGTDAPTDPQSYTMLHHVADMVDLIKSLGEREAVIVGHDWGAPVAWHAALLRPDIFRAVAGMSVPYSPPSGVDLLTALERQGISTFYMQYFQTPGVAEAELEADIEATIRRITFSMSGDGPGRVVAGVLPPGAGFLDATVEPESLPEWVSAEDISYVAGEFRRTGFRGGLNWYRAMRWSTELLAAWKGTVIRQPSLFIAGTRDDVMRFPGSEARLKKLPEVLPGMRGCHLIKGAGHWIQRERASTVNALLTNFLKNI
ncbi:alpha/beta hydrolase [Noviherbaspirillum sp. L7-7A]|uniref:alpha/beta fold hydrolase n=1 Tax=Noviherbaspirillum sp. L7-7A TaxID=2850560 RepID=UPI001C2B9416|nr:alpha/beta hydrolase [Noviherbaspirillum sp. L7-7A]MBV0881483.1 alpha/beta hydrolase [Noviherbaspirillum sp. L7-7A]